MDDRNEIDWERLDRFVTGAGSPGEQRALDEWVNSDPARRALADAMRSVGGARPDGVRPDAHRALLRVQQQLAMNRLYPGNGLRSQVRPVSAWLPARLIAMACAAGLMAALLLLPVTLGRRTVQHEPVAPPREYGTAPGQRASIELSDGTRVTLSPGSRLTVPSAYGESRSGREISLDGEALLRVRHDSLRPFVVRTEYGSAQDLGTEFVVNTYPESHGMRVAVREGRVAVRADGAAERRGVPATSESGEGFVAILGKGDVAHLAKGRLTVSHVQDLTPLFAGGEGWLALRATTLRDAIPLLDRWFGIRTRVAPPSHALLSRRISGTFRDGTASATVSTICVALQCAARWHGNEVTLVLDQTRGASR